MSAPVPSLSASGWVTDVAEKADLLMAYYFAADFSQSNTYQGQIISLPYEVQQWGNNPQQLQKNVTDDMKNYFGRYFDTVDVNVSTDIPSTTDPTRMNLTVAVIITDDGKQYSLGRLIQTLDGKILNIINLNNNG